MAGAEEELRLVAMFQDRASAGLKQMIDKMRSAAKGGQQATDDATKASNKQNKSYKQLTRSIREATHGIQQGFFPQVEKLGFGLLEGSIGLGALAAGFAAAGTAAKSFSNHSLRLGREDRLTRLSDDELKRWELLAPWIGASTEAIDAWLESFNKLSELMTRNEPLFRAQFAPQSMAWLRQYQDLLSMKDLPREQQFEGLTHAIMQIENVSQRMAAFEAFGLPKEFAAQSEDQLKAYFRRIDETTTRFTESQRAATRDAAIAWIDLGDALNDFKNHFGADFAPALTATLSGITGAFEAAGPAIGGFVDDMWNRIHASDVAGNSQFGKDLEEAKGHLSDLWRGALNWLGPQGTPEEQAKAIEGLMHAFNALLKGDVGEAARSLWRRPVPPVDASAKG